jgi:hypothetical protein
MKMPEHIKVLLDEMDLLIEKHEAVLLSEDYEAAHKYGEELCAFMERHDKTMNISDEQLEEMRRSRAKADASWQESKIAEAKAKQSRFAHEEAVQKYEEALLEVSPQGKKPHIALATRKNILRAINHLKNT